MSIQKRIIVSAGFLATFFEKMRFFFFTCERLIFMAMIVAVGRFELHFPHAQSLKEKRHSMKSLIDRVKAKFNASIAEVDFNDLWQRSLIGVAVVSNDRLLLSQMAQKIEDILEDNDQVRITDITWEYL